MDCSPPGSSVHGSLQARILVWVAMPSSRGSSQPRNRTQVSCVSCTAGGFFTAEPLTSLCSVVNEHSTERGKRQALSRSLPMSIQFPGRFWSTLLVSPVRFSTSYWARGTGCSGCHHLHPVIPAGRKWWSEAG